MANPTTASGIFAPNRDQIIKRAIRICNSTESGETPGSQEISDAIEALNAMVAEWQTLGIHIWTETEGVLFLQPNQIQYALGGTNTDQSCLDMNWVQTTVSNVAAQGATSIVVGSAAGISSGDNIGIMTSSNALFWTTVNGAPVNGAITLASSLPSAIAPGAIVVDYAPTYKLLRPLRIIDGRRYFLPSGFETPLIRSARLDYRDLPDKQNTGTIAEFFYDAQVGNSGSYYGKAFTWVWPAPPDSLSAVKFTHFRPIGSFVNPSDIPDFPQEWVNPLTWNLAKELGPEYNVPDRLFAKIERRATDALGNARGWDREDESVFIGVNFDQSSR